MIKERQPKAGARGGAGSTPRPSPPPADAPPQRERLALYAGIGVSLFALVLYIVTLSPTVNFIDSGELITVGYTAGIAHPPGYPLYTLLIILFARLPFGEPAVGVNLVSALGGALAAGLFYALVYDLLSHLPGQDEREPQTRPSQRAARRNGQQRQAAAPTAAVRHDGLLSVGVAAGAALLLSACYTFWNWSTMAKTYSLHYAFVAALLLLALRAYRSVHAAGAPGALWPLRDWPLPARRLAALAFGVGLSLTNHPMTTLLLPPVALLLLWPQPVGGVSIGRTFVPDAPLWRWLLRYLPALAVAGLLPLLLYLYLPLRSSMQPVMNWGSPSNLGDFYRHVTLWQSNVTLGQFRGTPFEYLGRAFEMYSNQLGWVLGTLVLVLAVVGAVRLARTSPAFVAGSGLLVLITLYHTYGHQIAEVAAYSVPMYMVFIAWGAVGLHWLISALVQRARPGVAQWAALAPVALGLLALALNFGRAGHAGDRTADAYVRNQFRSFAPNAIVLTDNWYLQSPAYYLQHVLGERKDVAVLDRKLMQYPYYLDYANRHYPDVMSTIRDRVTPFAEISRRWVDGGQIDSQHFSRLYFDMLRDLVTRNLAAGRPVYFQWENPGQEEAFIMQGFATHPEGMALRVDSQPYIGPPADPQFDFRGVLTDKVARDDIAPLVLDEYPVALDRLAAYAQQNNFPADAQKYAEQARQVRAALGLPQP